MYQDFDGSSWEPASNAELREALISIYNGWFCSWRDRVAIMEDYEWDLCISECDEILSHTHGSTAHGIAVVLLHELEGRRAGAQNKSA